MKMQSTESMTSTFNMGGIVRDWDGKLFEIADVKGDFLVLMPVDGGNPLVTKQALVDFFYKRMA
jgi:hypothetical protein